MTTQGIIIIDLCAILLVLLIVNLVRTRKLYVSYAVVWLVAIGAFIGILTSPFLLSLVTDAVGAVYPVSALSLLAFIFIFLFLIFFSVQLSSLSTRHLQLIEWLAIHDLLKQEKSSVQETPEKGTAGDNGS